MILPKKRDPRFITVRRGGSLQDADHHLLAVWAADCAQHVLHFFENIQPALLSFWQANRVDFFRPQGKINAAIYDSENQDVYKQTVYFNGVHFFNDLRERVGDEAFFAFLQDYYLQGRSDIVTSEDFFRILNDHTILDASDLFDEYFK